jgi:hypothetical protein
MVLNLARHATKSNVLFIGVAVYLALFAGIVYDFAYAPEGMGHEQGRPVAFYRFNLGRQYIVEGIASAIMLLLGGLGFIGITTFGNPALGSADPSARKPEWRHYFSLAMNGVLVIGAYNMLLLFMRLKLPNYLHMSKR